MADEPQVMTAEQAAAYLQLDPETVRVLLRQGKMPGNRIGRRWRIPKADVDAYLRGEWKPPQKKQVEPAE